MDNFVRIACAVNRVKPGSVRFCLSTALKSVEDAAALSPDIIVLPLMALCGISAGSLTHNGFVLESARDALDEIAVHTSNINSYIIAGLPYEGKSAAAVLHNGEILDFITVPDRTKLFDCGGLSFNVLVADPHRLPAYDLSGADLTIIPSALPLKAGTVSRVCDTVRMTSDALNSAICVCNGGIGESSAPFVYKGFSVICECGETLAFDTAKGSSLLTACDLDIDIIRGRRGFSKYESPCGNHDLNRKSGLLRDVRQNPFMPQDFSEALRVTEELFDLQARSITGRLLNTGFKKLVVGVSGGLDSTLALLASVKAFDLLGYNREGIITVTMPGFGTTGRTFSNAMELMKSLGTDIREISIKEAVTLHLSDIGHDLAARDVTYENAQARERAQILFDLANSEGALVIGTGDLSEAALGFTTFGGDHLAGFNVNSCFTKNMIRTIINYIAETNTFMGISKILNDILDTPVSPELLPPDESGEISQKTEELLGSYDINDFFLYYFVKYSMPPKKILYYACRAFEDYDEDTLREMLKSFILRFVSSQFKRNCCPEYAVITDFSLHASAHSCPSDLSAKDLLDGLE